MRWQVELIGVALCGRLMWGSRGAGRHHSAVASNMERLSIPQPRRKSRNTAKTVSRNNPGFSRPLPVVSLPAGPCGPDYGKAATKAMSLLLLQKQ